LINNRFVSRKGTGFPSSLAAVSRAFFAGLTSFNASSDVFPEQKSLPCQEYQQYNPHQNIYVIVFHHLSFIHNPFL